MTASGKRLRWTDLPARVTAGIEAILGDRVVEAVSQSGGFSPGAADRIRTAGGRRAFVKAVSPRQSERSPGLLRREAWVTRALPAHVPSPRVLGCYDDGTWVALVLEDIEGRHPVTPWRRDDLDRVLTALGDLAAAGTPAPVRDLRPAAEALAGNFAGWRRLATDPPTDLDPWARRHLDELCALADRGLRAVAGDTLVHLDVRADNLLIGPDGGVTLVDWPWACRGAGWLDTLLLLVNVELYGGLDTGSHLAGGTLVAAADPVDVLAVLVGFAGFFADAARQPAPVGLPTLRAFQRAHTDAMLPWIRDRLWRL